jgi:hypothetical protein
VVRVVHRYSRMCINITTTQPRRAEARSLIMPLLPPHKYSGLRLGLRRVGAGPLSAWVLYSGPTVSAKFQSSRVWGNPQVRVHSLVSWEAA